MANFQQKLDGEKKDYSLKLKEILFPYQDDGRQRNANSA